METIKLLLKHFFVYSETEPMLFSGIIFWVFLLVLLAGYQLVYRRNHIRNIYLFAFSLFFYYKSGGLFFWLLIFSTVIDYSLGIAIGKTERKLIRKLLVSFSVIVNLGVLSYFKYSYFYINTINSWFGTHWHVTNLLAEWSNQISGSHFNPLIIILPVGISFTLFKPYPTPLMFTADLFLQ